MFFQVCTFVNLIGGGSEFSFGTEHRGQLLMQRQGGASGFLLALFLVELRRQLLIRDEAGIPDYTLALALVELQFRGRFFVQGQEGFSVFIVEVVVGNLSSSTSAAADSGGASTSVGDSGISGTSATIEKADPSGASASTFSNPVAQDNPSEAMGSSSSSTFTSDDEDSKMETFE